MERYSNEFRESLKLASSGIGSGVEFAKLTRIEQENIIGRIDDVLTVARTQNPDNFKHEISKNGKFLF